MDVKEAIRKRKSIRAYLDKPIAKEIVDELLDAARLAPSGHNVQPWMFKIIRDDPKTIEKLKENNTFIQDFVYTAPLIIICCTNPEAYSKPKTISDYDDSNELRAVRDLTIAAQNMILRATELGLGTCYIGWLEKIKIKETLNIPSKYIVPYAISIGYHEEDHDQKPKPRKEIKEITF